VVGLGVGVCFLARFGNDHAVCHFPFCRMGAPGEAGWEQLREEVRGRHIEVA